MSVHLSSLIAGLVIAFLVLFVAWWILLPEGRRCRLTEPERKATVMALRARMRTEAGTFYELLRRSVEKLDS